MSLARKLNLKGPCKVIDQPQTVKLDDVEIGDGPAVLQFVVQSKDLDSIAAVVQAALADNIAWLAYPKAKKLGTDLNRDIIWKQMQQHGIDGVRMVSIDDTWSAMRFRPTT